MKYMSEVEMRVVEKEVNQIQHERIEKHDSHSGSETSQKSILRLRANRNKKQLINKRVSQSELAANSMK